VEGRNRDAESFAIGSEAFREAAMAVKPQVLDRARAAPDSARRGRGPSWGCAENCLKEILLRRGIRTGIGELSGFVKPGPEGASFADLVRAAEAKGLVAEPRKLTVESLEKSLLAGEGPCIVHLSWEGGHFSVAEAHEKRIRLIDPPWRVWESGPKRLRESFSGHAIFFKEA
jgi:ABC-type bacteriocin/lantibiotic exporter with double-glycine peptidase domain